MGSIHKVNDEYYVEFYARGLKYQQRAGRDLAAAEKLLQEIEAKIAKGEMATIVRDVDVDIFLSDFLEYARIQYPVRTWARYKSLTEHFHGFLQKRFPQLKKLSGVTPVVIEQYKEFLSKEEAWRKRKLKPHLVNLSLFLLAEVLEYSRKLGYLNDNPALHIRYLTAGQVRKPRIPTEEEMTRLFKAATIDFARVLEFVTLTGVTIEELIRLQWQDVNWTENCLEIKDTVLLKRSVPLTGRTIEILKNLQGSCYPQTPFIFVNERGQRQSVRYFADQLALLRADDKLGEKIAFLTLRHYFAHRLLRQNISLIVLNKLLGFLDVARILFYMEWVQDKQKDASASPLSL